ncbi:calcium uniporter protein, mitochondrial isoform X1 [Onthophagus taurus]|uniref:calcium uniporter protein, mitochondrial isoform X1 n=1 Tax=Onthophagus taurus TaxID=166361 RepID=UPI000C20E9DF|nr:calcium uniporter protein, mitochondrial isoform X2 [Onthophagus taurus]
MAVAGLFRCRVLCAIEIFKGMRYTTFIGSTQLNKSVHFRKMRHCRTFTSTLPINDTNKPKLEGKSSSSSTSSSDSDSEDEEVSIEYCRGLPQITVPLPSRKEKCRFTLRPVSHTVGDFLTMLRNEDKGIDRVVIKSTNNDIRIAASTSIETLLQEDFVLVVNDKCYNVCSPKQERVTSEEIQRLSDVQNLVGQLYEALNVKEQQVQKERVICTELETLQQELIPLEEVKSQLEIVAHRKSNWLAWAGLGLMSVQFGILARLTWWEYSWDIMEPVTYFVTYGTAMACYAYFVLTKQEYVLTDVKDRQHLITLHKKAKKSGFDVNKYNVLKDQITKLQKDLKKLNDPRKRLPLDQNQDVQEKVIVSKEYPAPSELKVYLKLKDTYEIISLKSTTLKLSWLQLLSQFFKFKY